MAEINSVQAPGLASQVMHYDETANLRANPEVKNAAITKAQVGASGHGYPSGAGYGGNLAQTDGTASPRANPQTLRAGFAGSYPGPTGVGPAAGNYGNGVASFPEMGGGLKGKGPQTPTPDEEGGND